MNMFEFCDMREKWLMNKLRYDEEVKGKECADIN